MFGKWEEDNPHRQGRKTEQRRSKPYLLQQAGERIYLSEKPFAGGGEGNLYHIVSPAKYKKFVAKIYHPHKLTEERARKIDYLSTYPPELEESNADGHSSVVWCTDVLLEDNRFVGFIMPFTKGEKLEILTTPKIPRKQRQAWQRFDFKAGASALTYRMKLAFNLCTAIHQVHKMERYVLVDMKPDNIVVQPNGLVSIVDTDSVEVVEHNQTLFDAPVATPEYTPPEHYQNLAYDPTQRQEWDLFGLGVILYKMLFGIHPFAASTRAPYEHLTTLAQKVEHGFFVHSPQHSDAFSIVPPPHQAFYQANEELQALFMRCFVDGHQQPDVRPTAEEWCAALLLATDDEAAYERYGHILKKQRGARRIYMSLPSSKIALPSVDNNNKTLALLEGSKIQDPSTPQLSSAQYLSFQETLEYKTWHALLIGGLAIGMTAVGLGIVAIIMVAIFLSKVNDNFKKTREFRSLRRDKVLLHKAQKKYKSTKRRTHISRVRLKRRLGKTARHIENILNLLKKEIQTLQTYLKEQDEKVKQLNQAANEQYRLINEEFMQQAKANRAVARVEVDQYHSLAQIKAALLTEQQKAVEELSRRHAAKDESSEYQQEKIAIEQLYDQRRINVQKKKDTEKSQLRNAQKMAIGKLHRSLEKDARLSSHWDRLWNGLPNNSSNQDKALQVRFHEAGLTSVLQIARIDLNDTTIELNNGQRILLRSFSPAKQILRNLLHWMDEIRHEKEQLAEEEGKINLGIQMGLDSIVDDERLEIKQLEQDQTNAVTARQGVGACRRVGATLSTTATAL